jgi:hypothetical protein
MRARNEMRRLGVAESGGRRHGRGAAGVGGCARLPSSAAELMIEEPQYHEVAGNSLTAKGREHT